MKLRNKKTCEIVEAHEIDLIDNYVYLKIFRAGDYDTKQYNSLAELNEEWEDYVEEKDYYTLNSSGQIWTTECFNEESIKDMKSIGNYFDTREEAEKAVEKLKAWKRLKDKGFRFDGWSAGLGKNKIYIIFWSHNDGEFDLRQDLDLLFGGEDE